MISAATISPCGLYRYDLTRTWDETRKPAMFVMLNPSTADSETDDPTILRCCDFARRWECGGIVVVNLFAYRSPHPKDLIAATNPIGPLNDTYIRRWAEESTLTIAAWGASLQSLAKRAFLRVRPLEVLKLLRGAGVTLHHLGLTEGGHPKHPLARGRHRIPPDVSISPLEKAVLV